MPTPEETQRKVDELKRAGYRIDIAPCPGLVRVTWRGRLVAQSDRALVLRETRHNPVIYVPRAAADMSLLQRTTHVTHCPFKGDASYFTLVNGAARAENAVWSYESPIADVAAIRQHLAFYTAALGADFGIAVEAPGTA
jgi:uncharacterized protein (DUF427 family)